MKNSQRDHKPINISKRRLLQGLGAALVLGIAPTASMAQTHNAKRPAAETEFGAFLRIDSTGRITVLICQAEIGQGSTTGLSMIVAEELGARWDDVNFEFASGRPEYFHPIIYHNEQITGGSVSIVGFMEPMRLVAAAAREMLAQAAANRLAVTTESLHVENSRVMHRSSGKSVAFQDLVAEAAKLPTPTEPQLKKNGPYRFLGKATKRLDVPPKVEGTAIFGIDVDLPNMAYAAVQQVPVFGDEIKTIDAAEALKSPGVLAVHPIPNGYAVVAEQYWQAQSALPRVKIDYHRRNNGLATSAHVNQALLRALEQEEVLLAHEQGNTGKNLQANDNNSTLLESTYRVPFLAHATMEPMNATASVTPGKIELWVPTQAVTLDQIAVGQALGVEPNQVKIHMTYVGGAFGRRGFSEYAVQAALLSREMKRPVKVIWSRAEDIKQDYLRPAFAAKMQGHISKNGEIKALATRVAGPGIWMFNRPPVVEYFKGIDHLAVEGLNDLRYGIPHTSVHHAVTKPNRKIGYWRSIGYSHNVYYVESFVDELAHAVGADPFEVRFRLLREDKRSQKVLKVAAEKAGWLSPRKPNRYLGIAFFATERWQTRVAQIADVSIVADKIKINKMICVADVGMAINPLSVEAQLQGAVLFGLTAALYGQIDLQNGEVQQSNFSDYRMLTLRDAPPVEVTIVQGADKPGSVGEIGTPCAAPALVNAVFAATGRRIRELPLAKQGLI